MSVNFLPTIDSNYESAKQEAMFKLDSITNFIQKAQERKKLAETSPIDFYKINLNEDLTKNITSLQNQTLSKYSEIENSFNITAPLLLQSKDIISKNAANNKRNEKNLYRITESKFKPKFFPLLCLTNATQHSRISKHQNASEKKFSKEERLFQSINDFNKRKDADTIIKKFEEEEIKTIENRIRLDTKNIIENKKYEHNLNDKNIPKNSKTKLIKESNRLKENRAVFEKNLKKNQQIQKVENEYTNIQKNGNTCQVNELESSCFKINSLLMDDFKYFIKFSNPPQSIMNIAIVFAKILNLCEQFPSKSLKKWNQILNSYGFTDKIIYKCKSILRKISANQLDLEKINIMCDKYLSGSDIKTVEIESINYSASVILQFILNLNQYNKVLFT